MKRTTKAIAIVAGMLEAVGAAGCHDSNGPASITVTAVSPANGALAGGTSVTITGTNFIDVTGVTIGGSALGSRTVESTTQITGTTPAASSAGAKDVVVTSSSQGSSTCSGCFAYVAGALSVTAVSPPSGARAGGTSVTITGTNFVNVTSVTIGGNELGNRTVVSPTQITGTTPAASSPGAKDVVVTSSSQGSSTCSGCFTYVAGAVTVTAVSPASGPVAGGTSVTITGTNFINVTTVTIGGTELGNRTVVSSTQITGTTPAASSSGAKDVVVTSSSQGSGTCGGCFSYVYVAIDGQIAFTSWRDGNGEIYLMNADGSQVRLTNDPAYDCCAAWSPHGTKLAFFKGQAANDIGDIYLMNADGSGQVNLTNDPASDIDPRWSPDGTRIAFQRLRYDANGWTSSGVYVMNADGSGVTELTNDSWACCSRWSPDGTKLAFWRLREIYVMNADGSGQVNLTNDPATDNYPAWSPDGTKIAFESTRDGNWEIYLMNADGSGVLNLTNDPARDLWPVWSPDGTKLAFESERDGNWEIYVMNADGSGQVNLTNNPYSDYFPVWRPQ